MPPAVLALGTCVLETAPFFLRSSSLRLEQPRWSCRTRAAPRRRVGSRPCAPGRAARPASPPPTGRARAWQRARRARCTRRRARWRARRLAPPPPTCLSTAHEAAALAPRHDAARHRRHEHDAALRWHAQLVERRGPAVRCLEPLDQLGELKLGGQVDAAEAQLLEHPARTARRALREGELRLEDRCELV